MGHPPRQQRHGVQLVVHHRPGLPSPLAQQALHRGGELHGIERLGEVGVGARLLASHPVLQGRLGGEHDHRRVAEPGIFLDSPAQLEAIHPGHHPVGDHQVRAHPLDDLPALDAVRGHVDLEVLAQVHVDQLQHLPVVLADQDPVALQLVPRHTLDGAALGDVLDLLIAVGLARQDLHRPLGEPAIRHPALARHRHLPAPLVQDVRGEVVHAGTQDHAHRGPLPQDALGVDLPAVEIRDLLHQGQADPRPPVPPGGGVVHLREAVEDGAQPVVRDADPAVLDLDPGTAVVQAVEADLDPATDRGELHGVGQQVQHHPLELLRVQVDVGGRLAHHHADRHVLAVRQGGHVGHDGAQEGRQVHRLRIQLEVGVLELGQVEHVVDQLEQPQRVAVHRLEDGDLLGIEVAQLARQDRVDGGQDQGQRRAQLMGDVREQGALHPVEFLELLVGTLQLGLGHLQLGGALLDLLLQVDVEVLDLPLAPLDLVELVLQLPHRLQELLALPLAVLLRVAQGPQQIEGLAHEEPEQGARGRDHRQRAPALPQPEPDHHSGQGQAGQEGGQVSRTIGPGDAVEAALPAPGAALLLDHLRRGQAPDHGHGRELAPAVVAHVGVLAVLGPGQLRVVARELEDLEGRLLVEVLRARADLPVHEGRVGHGPEQVVQGAPGLGLLALVPAAQGRRRVAGLADHGDEEAVQVPERDPVGLVDQVLVLQPRPAAEGPRLFVPQTLAQVEQRRPEGPGVDLLLDRPGRRRRGRLGVTSGCGGCDGRSHGPGPSSGTPLPGTAARADIRASPPCRACSASPPR